MSDMAEIDAQGTSAMRNQATVGIRLSERITLTWGPATGDVETVVAVLRKVLAQEGVSYEETQNRITAFRNASASISEQAQYLSDAFSRYNATISMIEQAVIDARASKSNVTFRVDA